MVKTRKIQLQEIGGKHTLRRGGREGGSLPYLETRERAAASYEVRLAGPIVAGA